MPGEGRPAATSVRVASSPRDRPRFSFGGRWAAVAAPPSYVWGTGDACFGPFAGPVLAGPQPVALLSLAIAARLCGSSGLGSGSPGQVRLSTSTGTRTFQLPPRFAWQLGVVRPSPTALPVGRRSSKSSDLETCGADEVSEVLVAIGVPA